jgi:hypothetical protein
MPFLPKETTMCIRAVSPWSRCHTRVATHAALAVVALFALAGSAQAAAPGNDDFANAIALSGSSGSESGSNVDATAQAGEPQNHAAELDAQGGDLGNTSVWYEWTAPTSGLVGFDTEDVTTDYDTVLGVYTGSLGSLNEVEFNDDYGGSGLSSRVVFNAVAGQTYKISVAGCCGVPATGSSASGAFTLKWGTASRPGNDDFALSTPIAGSTGTQAGNNFDATEQPGEPRNHLKGADLGADSVWYSWTAPTSGRYVFTAPGTSFDPFGTFIPAIGAYTGDLSALNEVGFGTRAVAFDAVAGTTYRIGVGGAGGEILLNRVYWGDMGSFTLTWTEDEIPPDTTITSASGGKQSLTYTFTGSDNHSPASALKFQCKLDGSAFQACLSPKTIAPIAGGRHTVQVRAIDQAGNIDPTPAVKEIRVKGGSKGLAAIRKATKRRVSAARVAKTRKAKFQPRKGRLAR